MPSAYNYELLPRSSNSVNACAGGFLRRFPRPTVRFSGVLRLVAVIILLLVAGLVGATFKLSVKMESRMSYLSEKWRGREGPVAVADAFAPSHYLNGPPTASFRENLKPDLRYVTAGIHSGFTNQFIEQCHLILLGILSRRIPILPPFTVDGGHVKGSPPMDFGEVFDLSRLRDALRMPMLDWSDVKKLDWKLPHGANRTSPENISLSDTIGCWGVHRKGKSAGHVGVMRLLKLDIMYSGVPEAAFLRDYFASFTGLAALLRPEAHKHAVADPKKLPTTVSDKKLQNMTILPDEHLACFDSILYVGAKDLFEYEKELNPMWALVGTNVHFSSRMDAIASGYLRRLFNVASDAEIPPFITVHVRHNDFANTCRNVPVNECLPPVSAYARRVDQLRRELSVMHPHGTPLSHVTEVIIASDEVENSFWQEVANMGWRRIDHNKEDTVRKLSSWYPVLIDQVVLSKGAGFVGTKGSTMSIVAEGRVRDWNNGPTWLVKWGTLNADAGN